MGPIALFDKSFLQSLSTDESVWFDHFFYPVVVPVFYIETLADLEKKPREGKSAEEEVGIIAVKTPQMSGAPCYFHQFLCVQNLLGAPVPMNGQIPMAGARQVVRNGKYGAIVDEPPESLAFARWQDGRFYEVERQYAREWRAQLESINLGAIQEAMQRIGIRAQTCRTLKDAKKLADAMVSMMTRSPGRFDLALSLLDIPDQHHRAIKDRWKHAKRPALSLFAPYAAHVLSVEVFFRVALGANLIAATRASNRADIAYLFYAPFCHLFVSSDRLHRITAPLYLRPDQEFVWGRDLKGDLTQLDSHFKSLPENLRSQGVYKLGSRLPDQSQGKIRELMQRFAPNLLKPPVDPGLISVEAHAKLMGEMQEWDNAPAVESPQNLPDGEWETMILKRSVHRQRGSWIQIGPEVKG